MPKALEFLDVAGVSSLIAPEGSERTVPEVDRKKHGRSIHHLKEYIFWKGRKSIKGLWKHQQAAISHSLAYLCADACIPNESNILEAALLKLPTGTGKSGIVAVLARCLPEVKRVLLLTPRTALTEQLLNDVQWRFWKNMGFSTKEGETWKATAKDAGAKVEGALVTRLMPNLVSELSEELADGKGRIILVATLQALDQVRRMSARKVNADSERAAEVQAETVRGRELLNHLRAFDLVIVDEGHYEPAASWSRSIRGLNRKTILLSATPFRNDYKSFRVRGNFVYNLPYQEAVASRIVRHVQFNNGGNSPGTRQIGLPNAYVEGAAEHDTKAVLPLTEAQHTLVDEFVQCVRKELIPILNEAVGFASNPKCIVRAATFEVLELLQSTIALRLDERALLIHDRVVGDSSANLQFHNVRAALKQGQSVRFWLHQSKLLEGIDDPTIVAVGIVDGFANTRQLVQQIGRAIRSTDPTRTSQQVARIVALPEILEEMQIRWGRYLKYEQIASRNVKQIIQAEGAMPDRLLDILPEYQYVDGDFRARYLLNGNVRAVDVRLSLRASVFLTNDDFEDAEAEVELDEALLAADRFVPRPIEGMPPGAFGRTYYSWKNTPYLADQYLAEWTLGICIVIRLENFLFIQDTGGICFDPERLRIRKAGRDVLLKAFPDSENGTTLTRISGNSLDMSDRAIRAQAFRTRSLESTFTDLADPSFVPSSAYGYVAGTGRYVGLARARLSDASEGMLGLPDYQNWIVAIHETLSSARERHRVFDRYAQVTTVEDEEAKPVSILLDLSSEALQEFNIVGEVDGGALGDDAPYDDLCADVDDSGTFRLRMRDNTEVRCSISYNSKSKRYNLKSAELNARFPLPKSRSGTAQTITELVNREQNFRILVAKQQVVYSLGAFYVTRDLVSQDGRVFALEDASAIRELANTTSEKGEFVYATDFELWQRQSVFGVIYAFCRRTDSPRHELERSIQELDTVLLDDGPQEVGDFIGIDRTRKRVIIIHAKASRDAHRDAVSELQVVGRQAIASLAFCSTQARVFSLKPERWQLPVTANTVRLDGLSRWFKQVSGESMADAASAVLAALANPSYNREVWIVAGRLLDVAHVRATAKRSMSNRCRQLLMYLTGLQTACQRANCKLRIFAHENAPTLGADMKTRPAKKKHRKMKK